MSILLCLSSSQLCTGDDICQDITSSHPLSFSFIPHIFHLFLFRLLIKLPIQYLHVAHLTTHTEQHSSYLFQSLSSNSLLSSGFLIYKSIHPIFQSFHLSFFIIIIFFFFFSATQLPDPLPWPRAWQPRFLSTTLLRNPSNVHPIRRPRKPSSKSSNLPQPQPQPPPTSTAVSKPLANILPCTTKSKPTRNSQRKSPVQPFGKVKTMPIIQSDGPMSLQGMRLRNWMMRRIGFLLVMSPWHIFQRFVRIFLKRTTTAISP